MLHGRWIKEKWATSDEMALSPTIYSMQALVFTRLHLSSVVSRALSTCIGSGSDSIAGDKVTGAH